MEYTFQEMPDVHKSGERKVYPKAAHYTQIEHELFISQLAQRSGFSRGTIEGVLSEVAHELGVYMQNGHSVKVDGLGTFSLTLGMKNHQQAEELREKGERYDTYNVFVKSVHFLPDANWMRKLRGTTILEKVGDVKRLRTARNSREERYQMALKYLETYSFMRVINYVELTGVRYHVALKELRAFSQDPESLIVRSGRGSHLIYIKKG